ncbi:MAG: PAS domain S-box protein [Rhodospirillaceae bacterium]|nr:PAS domain S-box protein [Rhodospirillaceae bacterium]
MNKQEITKPSTLSGDDLQQQVMRDCIKALYKNAKPTLVANVVISILVALVVWSETASQVAFYWLGVNLVINILRYVVLLLFPKSDAEIEQYKNWAKYYGVGTIFAGAAWGFAGFAFMAPHLQILDAFMIIGIMGMATGAASSLAPHFPTFMAFALPAIAPLVIQLLIRGSVIDSVLGILGILFSMMLVIAARNTNRTLCMSLAEKFKSEALAHDLALERDEHERSKSIFRGIIENAGDAIFIHDRFGQIVDVNQTACMCLGYGRNELLRLNMAEIVEREIIPNQGNAWDMERMDHSSFPLTTETKHRRKSGTTFPVEVRIGLLSSEGENLYIALARDISERKEAEEKANRNATNLANAQRIAHFGSYEWNITTGELLWSDEHYRIWELAPQSVVPSFDLFIERVHPEDVERAGEAIKYAIDTGEPLDMNIRLLMPDGRVKFVESLGEVKYDDNGTAVGMSGTIHDVTKEHEIRIALSESEARFRGFAESTSDWFWEMDDQLRVSYLSERFESVTGHPASSVLGKTRRELADPEHVKADKEKWEKHFSELDFHRPFRNFEYEILPQFGGVAVTISVSGVPIFDETGKFRGYRGSGEDVTERKIIQQKLLAAKEEAENANKAKSQFLSSMSHELRTPLNSILGFTQLLQLDPTTPLTDKQKDSTNQVIKSGHHLLDLIDQVLELAKIEAGNMSVSIEPVQIRDLVGECLDMISSMASKRHININYDMDKTPDAVVMGDRVSTKQVLLNLLSNAVKYNRESGSISVDVKIIDNKKMYLSVSDTGPGIPKEKQGRVFEPFNRLGHESSEIEGTGIGLVITREMLHMMNGEIGFNSEEGKGTTFWIELPLADDDALKSGGTSKKQSNTDALKKFIGAKNGQALILYVEDNPANQQLMEKVFENIENIDLIITDNAESGIEIATSKMPDTILMDINLPGISGIDATIKLKQMEKTKNIPVIAITAAAMSHEIEKAKDAGFDAYLAKP